MLGFKFLVPPVAASGKSIRWFSSAILTNSSVRLRRNELFEREKKRQLANINRIEKIEVKVLGPPEEVVLIMNKDLSTPYNCAMHINEVAKSRSVLAEVNGVVADMHLPLKTDCELRFLHFKEENPHECNKAFWRSCSFILGYIAERVFKDEFFVELHSFPPPRIESGSFVHDIDIKIDNWSPRRDELNTMSLIGQKLQMEPMNFERLEVNAALAQDLFSENRYKCSQIPSIAAQSESGNNVVLYRLGDHIDISKGPMMSHTGLIYKYNIAAVFRLDTDEGSIYRFQGTALPRNQHLNAFAYNILVENAARFNNGPIMVPLRKAAVADQMQANSA